MRAKFPVTKATLCGLVLSVVTSSFAIVVHAQSEDRARRTSAPPQQISARPAGEAIVTITEEFVNSLLDALLSQSRPPTFPLAQAGRTSDESAPARGNHSDTLNGQNCASQITLLRESGGVRTAVRFRDGRITAPIAFRGSYSAGLLLGCVRFQGWADTEINLSFDRERQRLVAHVTVREVNLDGVPALTGGIITGLVQNSLDDRINPLQILRTEQLGARIPIPEGGALRLNAREVQPEIRDRELRLRLFYEVVSAER